MGEENLMTGYLFKQHKSLMRSWQKKWCVLSLNQDDGKAVLSMYDSRENAGSTNKKTVYFDLSTNTAVVKNKNKEFYFEITTDAKTYGFAADTKEEMTKWLEVLTDVASGRSRAAKKDVPEYANDGDRQPPEPPIPGTSPFEKFTGQENTAYMSVQKSVFHTVMKPVEKALELNLSGEYDLILDSVNIALVDPKTRITLYAWPYKYLRRYGRDRTMFSFEAGRRCESGAGIFEFSTTEGNDIFYTVDNFVRELKGLPPNPREVNEPPIVSTPPPESAMPIPQQATVDQVSPVLGQRPPPQRSLPPIPPPGAVPLPDMTADTRQRPFSVADHVRELTAVSRTRSDTSGVKVKPTVPAKPKLESTKGGADKKGKSPVQDKRDITYAETTNRQEAWKQQGRSVNIHVENTFNPEQEDYDIPKRVGPEDTYEETLFESKPPVAQPAEPEAYDHLQLKPMKRMINKLTSGTSTYDSLDESSNVPRYAAEEEDQYETVRQSARGTIDPVDLQQDEEGYFTHSKRMIPSAPAVDFDDTEYAYAGVTTKAHENNQAGFTPYDQVNN